MGGYKLCVIWMKKNLLSGFFFFVVSDVCYFCFLNVVFLRVIFIVLCFVVLVVCDLVVVMIVLWFCIIFDCIWLRFFVMVCSGVKYSFGVFFVVLMKIF